VDVFAGGAGAFVMMKDEMPRRALAALAILSLLLAACGSPADSSAVRKPPPVSVEMVTVKPDTILDVLDLVGQLEADESVVVRSETEGIVESVEFQEGDHVETGALLFRLRDDEQTARLREAEAQLALATDDFQRASTLARQGSMSQAEFDSAKSKYEVAKARRDLAKVELDRTQIRAPFDGVLGARKVSPGERIDSDVGLVRIDSIDRLRLLFSVPEMAVRAVRNDMPVEVKVAPWPEESFPGQVYFVAPSLDTSNRRLLLKAWVPNPDRKLRPGLFATIRLEVARHENALVVPEAAVAYDADGPFVWRIGTGDVAERVPVELGLRQPGKVEVTSGVAAGDRIVSAGTHKVSAGARVRQATLVPAAEVAEGEAAGAAAE
jgi:membrane fusion protein (multidrug efflux system)